jgi:transcriptional regulator with XRE-family HTH domain
MAVLPRQLEAAEDAHDRLGLSYEQVAAALRANSSSLHRWRSGEVEPSPVFLDRLEALGELMGQLRRTFRSDAMAREWFDRPVPAFSQRTPRVLLVEGKIERITAALEGLNTGMTT